MSSSCKTNDGFENGSGKVSIPLAESVTGKGPVPYSGVADLPSAPINSLGQTNSLPFQDPAMVKGTKKMLRQLKQDMDGFAAFEMPNFPDISDPSIKLPLTRFKGDYQRIKDEIAVVDRTPGIEPQISVREINDIAANLRFLQRTYRTYANNEMVPAPTTPECEVGLTITEGFDITSLTPNGGICSKSQQCQSGSCDYGQSPHKCVNPSDFQNTVAVPSTSGGSQSVPSECYGAPGVKQNFTLGYAGAGGYRLYSQSDCENNLKGVWASDGMCYTKRQPDGTLATSTSWSYICRNLTGGTGSTTVTTTKSTNVSKAGENDDTSWKGKRMWNWGSDESTADAEDEDEEEEEEEKASKKQKDANGDYDEYDNWTQWKKKSGNSGGWWDKLKSSLTSDPDYSDDPNYDRISPVQLEILIQKLNVELVRLQASGSTDPVIQARVNVFTRIKYSLMNVQKDLKSGTISPDAIPIRVSDYNNFLPALDTADSEIPNLLYKTGFANLFGKFFGTDSSGNQISDTLINKYTTALLSGLSYKVDINYVSPNEVAIHQADAVKAMYENGGKASEIDPGFFESFESGHPMTMGGSRGEFEDVTRRLDKEGFEGSMGIRAPKRRKPAGTFDWKKRSQEIYENVKKAAMNPADYGFNPDIYAKGGSAADFSWRGHTKMVCNRLATHVDNAMPEQLGCPPASWKGWRS